MAERLFPGVALADTRAVLRLRPTPWRLGRGRDAAELVLTEPDGGVHPDDWYQALAFLLAERSPA